MVNEQIKALAKQAIKNVGKPYYPDANSKISLFQEDELAEFVRLVRESALIDAASACLSRHANGDYVCDDRNDCNSAIKELMK